MSAISVRWDAGDVPILRIGLTSPVSWAALEAAKQMQDRVGFPERWGVLIDLSEAGNLPDLSVLRLAHLMRDTPAGACAFAVVGARIRVRAMIPLLARLSPSLEPRFYVADSDAEACAWLANQLARVPAALLQADRAAP